MGPLARCVRRAPRPLFARRKRRKRPPAPARAAGASRRARARQRASVKAPGRGGLSPQPPAPARYLRQMARRGAGAGVKAARQRAPVGGCLDASHGPRNARPRERRGQGPRSDPRPMAASGPQRPGACAGASASWPATLRVGARPHAPGGGGLGGGWQSRAPPESACLHGDRLRGAARGPPLPEPQ